MRKKAMRQSADKRVCVVRTQRSVSVGELFMKTRTHIVLINGIRQGADLGPIKKVKTRHIEPEGLVYVIPRRLVEDVQFLGPVP